MTSFITSAALSEWRTASSALPPGICDADAVCALTSIMVNPAVNITVAISRAAVCLSVCFIWFLLLSSFNYLLGGRLHWKCNYSNDSSWPLTPVHLLYPGKGFGAMRTLEIGVLCSALDDTAGGAYHHRQLML
jgi:hypothetical protein